jgi:hypothetical protein
VARLLTPDRPARSLRRRAQADAFTPWITEYVIKALCTDNASVMRKTWRLLRAKFPGLLTYGCAAHAFNLHAKDICALSEFSSIVAQVNSVAVYFSHNLGAGGLATLRNYQTAIYGKHKAVSSAGKTRWSSQITAALALVATKDALFRTVNDQEWSRSKENANAVRALILDVDHKFWPAVELLIRVLEPIRMALIVLQGDDVTLGDVYAQWIAVHLAHSEIEESDFISAGVSGIKDELMDILVKRIDFLIHPAHIVAYAFHPHYAKASAVERALVRQLAHRLAADGYARAGSEQPVDFEADLDKEMDTFFGPFLSSQAYKAAWTNSTILPVSAARATGRRVLLAVAHTRTRTRTHARSLPPRRLTGRTRGSVRCRTCTSCSKRCGRSRRARPPPSATGRRRGASSRKGAYGSIRLGAPCSSPSTGTCARLTCTRARCARRRRRRSSRGAGASSRTARSPTRRWPGSRLPTTARRSSQVMSL